MSHNPLIEKLYEKDLIQTVSIALPTQGRFYEPGILAPEADPMDMEIRAIGVMAELYAKDPFVVASGKGLARIVSHVCPMVLKPERLCEVDVEAILIAARLVSHGAKYQVKHRCENPEKTKAGTPVCDIESDVDIDLQRTIMNYEPLDYNDDFVVDIPEAEQRVWIKPMEYKDAMSVVKRGFLVEQTFRGIVEKGIDKFFTDEDITEEYAQAIDQGADIALRSLADSIFCVEDPDGTKVGDSDVIVAWLDILPEQLGKRIGDAIAKVASTLRDKSKVTYTCPHCGHENTFPLVLDPQRLFFSEVETSKTPKTPSSTSKKNRRGGTRPPRTSQKSHTPSKE